MRIQVGGYRDISKIQWAEIDDEDAEMVAEFKWTPNRAKNTIYAVTHNGGVYQQLHRVVMGLVPGDKQFINHKDGNGLNCRKENLEFSNPIHNSQSFRCANSTRNVGTVAYCKNYRGIKKYGARIIINKKQYFKWFATEAEGRAWIATLVQEHLA